MQSDDHFKMVAEGVGNEYDLARMARKKGFDPVQDVEIPIATTLAEKCVGLISSVYPQLGIDRKIVNRILELEKKFGSLDPGVALSIAEEIAKEKYCKFEGHKEAMEAGIRVAVSYMTLGVVSSPIEGFVELKIGKRMDGKEYLAPYYSGPIRSAGGTEAAFSLVVVDHLRETFGYAPFDPIEDEIKRGVHESYLYHERVTNLQYLPTEAEIEFLMRYLPIQVSGDPSEKMEVYNHKDLPRVESNFIRSGFCLTLNEGLAQKAPKILKRVKSLRVNGFKLSDWDFLEKFVDFQNNLKKQKKADISGGAVYMKDLVAGRPVFGHPSRSGGFRLRYGRCRNSGYSCLAVHPASMIICDNFIAVGTQLKTEKPTKGCVVASCTSIDGPIVKLKSGEVKQIWDCGEAKELYKDVKEIIYLGDLLVPYGDFRNRNATLEKQGYVEQYWLEELRKAGGDCVLLPSLEEALKISEEYGVALHPKFIYYWREISKEDLFALLDWVGHGVLSDGKLVLPWTKRDQERFVKGKRAMELLGVEHKVSIENIVLDVVTSKAFLINLGFEKEEFDKWLEELSKKVKNSGKEKVLEIVDFLCKYKIRDKSGVFIGARMGRPEKAKLRKLVGSPHVLFPVGNEGGRLRSFQAAMDVGCVRGEFPNYYCGKCDEDRLYPLCEKCGDGCKIKESEGRGFVDKKVDIRKYFDDAKKISGVRVEDIPIVKGVRGTSNKDHSTEFLAKGLLRAKYNLHVNKDGTIRYDMIEMPLTHFKPKEIGTSVEKLKELGYLKDVFGKLLESEEQVLELMPHDVVMPACPDTLDEKSDDVFFKICNFVDDELDKIYGLERYFNLKSKGDLPGVLLGCMAPHNCASVVGRLIGFSKTQGMLASPYMHAAMRRDCLAGDNFVSVHENGKWKIEKIGEFVEGKKPNKIVDNWGTVCKRMRNVGTWSNPRESRIEEITKHKPREILKIKLEDGREIKCTENHRLYMKGKKEKRARDLVEGDKLMVSYLREIRERDIEYLFLPEIFQDKDDVMLRNVRGYLSKFEVLSKHENFVFRDSFPIKLVREILERNGKKLIDLPEDVKVSVKRDNVILPTKIKLDSALLEVIGLYIAEGYLREGKSEKNYYQLSVAGNEDIKRVVKSVFLSHFGLKPSYENEDQVVYSSKLVYDLFGNYLGAGHGAKNKRIPSLFLDLKKEKLAALLRGYYEGDGSVSLSDIRVSCDTVSEGLKYDLSFVLSRFGIFTKFYDYVSFPGSAVREFYLKKGRDVPKFKMTKIIIPSNFVEKFKEIGFLSKRKSDILDEICKRDPYGMKIDFDEKYAYPKIVGIERCGNEGSYCFNVAGEHNFFANDLLVHNCDGDEAAVMLLMDMLLNFSKKFLPAHRGGTQDAPLVVNARIRAGEVDDMIFDVDVSKVIPLELYEAAEEKKSPYDVKMEQVKDRLGGKEEFRNLWYSYDTDDINLGPLCSSYKTLPSMQEKVEKQMELCKKIRAVDTSDVARLIIERHFIRDTMGNLRKFSMQSFRCVGCNEIYRRPPLVGKCEKCGGRLIFTISHGSIIKYLQPALDLAREFGGSKYLIECLELAEMYVQSIFGREKEKQEALGKWF